MSGIVINGGSRVVNKYEVGRSLWKGVAVPYCLYGSEVTHYREGDIAHLEKAQNTVGRWGLGAPRSTAVEAVRGDMGWSTFRERIIKGKLGFLKKVEAFEGDRWAKKVLQENRTESTWQKELERWKRRENMSDRWRDTSFKETKRRIEKNGQDKWREGINRKTTLQWYSRKDKPEAVTWHTGDWGSRLLFKARTGTLEVNGKSRDGGSQLCDCGSGDTETVEHLLVACRNYDRERERLVRAVVTVIGEEEWDRRADRRRAGSVHCTRIIWRQAGY